MRLIRQGWGWRISLFVIKSVQIRRALSAIGVRSVRSGTSLIVLLVLAVALRNPFSEKVYERKQSFIQVLSAFSESFLKA